MASPQLKEGYTSIANEILERIALLGFNGTQFRIIMTVWRYTYGFKRKQHALSVNFLSKATGIHKITLSKELKRLIDWNIILIAQNSTFTKAREISFNKDYDSYRIGQQLINPLTVSESANTTVSQFTNTTVSESANQEIKYKTNIKENIYSAFFNSLWELYPCKKGKSKVTKKTIRELHNLGYETIKGCIDRYKAAKPDWQEWQHGSTFFNGGYVDYLERPTTEKPVNENADFEREAQKLGITVEELRQIVHDGRNC